MLKFIEKLNIIYNKMMMSIRYISLIHNSDRAAIIWPNGTLGYLTVDGVQINYQKNIMYPESDASMSDYIVNNSYAPYGLLIVTPFGRKEYYFNGKLHRENMPAVIQSNGSKEYWIDGKMHRENGPAIEWSSGRKEYWINDHLHRENGPAVIQAHGGFEYWMNGQLHREDGAAIIWPNGSTKYFVNGKLHRLDGPAITYNSNHNNIMNFIINDDNKPKNEYHTEWYINGTEITSDVVNWLSVTGYKWPFNEQQQFEFKLRFYN